MYTQVIIIIIIIIIIRPNFYLISKFHVWILNIEIAIWICMLFFMTYFLFLFFSHTHKLHMVRQIISFSTFFSLLFILFFLFQNYAIEVEVIPNTHTILIEFDFISNDWILKNYNFQFSMVWVCSVCIHSMDCSTKPLKSTSKCNGIIMILLVQAGWNLPSNVMEVCHWESSLGFGSCCCCLLPLFNIDA